MFRWLVKHVVRPKWVAFHSGEDEIELGMKIWGVTIGLYKAEALYYKHVITRPPHKREFGESVHPVSSYE